MKLTLATALLLAAPMAAAAQAHGGGAPAAGVGRAGAAHAVAAHGGGGVIAPAASLTRAGRLPFDGRFGHHRGFRGRFDRRIFVVGVYPYPYPDWGWSGCAPDSDCDWQGQDPPGPSPAAYDGAPVGPPGYAVIAAPRRVEVNECSDWVWRADLRRSVCKRPFRG